MAATEGEKKASRKMHDYLATKQNKKEQMWMRKYGALDERRLPPAIASPEVPLPAPPPAHAAPKRPGRSLSPAKTRAVQRRMQDYSVVKRLTGSQGGSATSLAAPYDDVNTTYSPEQQQLLQSLGEAGNVDPGGDPDQEAYDAFDASSLPSPLQQAARASGGGLSTGLPLLPRASGGGGGGARAAAPKPPPPAALQQALAVVPRAAPKPLKELEAELHVLKAIKAREDVLDKLQVLVEKIDKSLATSSGVGDLGASSSVLSAGDSLVKMLYRLVASLRTRTLDVVESVAAWQRKVAAPAPFMYLGADYVMGIGDDLSFLDAAVCLRHRLAVCAAVDDPFLVYVTPDGIPLEDATTYDLRKGNKMSPDALRIRTAKKVLASQGHPAYVEREDGGEPVPRRRSQPAAGASPSSSPERASLVIRPPPPPAAGAAAAVAAVDLSQQQARPLTPAKLEPLDRPPSAKSALSQQQQHAPLPTPPAQQQHDGGENKAAEKESGGDDAMADASAHHGRYTAVQAQAAAATDIKQAPPAAADDTSAQMDVDVGNRGPAAGADRHDDDDGAEVDVALEDMIAALEAEVAARRHGMQPDAAAASVSVDDDADGCEIDNVVDGLVLELEAAGGGSAL